MNYLLEYSLEKKEILKNKQTIYHMHTQSVYSHVQLHYIIGQPDIPKGLIDFI